MSECALNNTHRNSDDYGAAEDEGDQHHEHADSNTSLETAALGTLVDMLVGFFVIRTGSLSASGDGVARNQRRHASDRVGRHHLHGRHVDASRVKGSVGSDKGTVGWHGRSSGSRHRLVRVGGGSLVVVVEGRSFNVLVAGRRAAGDNGRWPTFELSLLGLAAHVNRVRWHGVYFISSSASRRLELLLEMVRSAGDWESWIHLLALHRVDVRSHL